MNWIVIQEAKHALAAAGCSGSSLAEMVAHAVRTMHQDADDRRETKAILRQHGANPNGKRLADAVDEALRFAKRGDL